MADDVNRHVIEILVRAINRAGDIGDQIARSLDSATRAQERNTRSVKDSEKSIEQLRKEYEAFTRQVRDGTKDVDSATFGLRRFATEFERLARRQPIGSGLSEDLNKSANSARELERELKSLGEGSDRSSNQLGRLDRILERLHGTSDRVGFSIARIDNNLRGLLVLGVVAFSQQIISALTALGTTFLAVATTAAQAGGAIGGAMAAAAAQAIPTIGLLIAAFGRIGAVFEAVDLFNKQLVRSGRDQAAAADAQAAAADRVASAQEGVAAAMQRVQDAQEALIEARERAIRNIEDLNLAERRASLTAFESQRALRQAVATGDVGALEGLRIQTDTAGLGARRTATDAREARTQGVEGSDEVRQAVRTLEDANTALGRARREMQAANRAATRAAESTSAADTALAEALAQLTSAERELYRSIKRIQDTFKRLFRPVTDIVVRAFTDAVDRTNKVLGDSRIVGTFRTIAKAVADSFRAITREFTSARWLNFFKEMGDEAARNIPLLTQIGIRLSRILGVIARAASPALRKFLEFLEQIVIRGDEATNSKSGLTRLQRFFLKGEEYAESIAKLAFAFIELFAALAGAGGAETGQEAIDNLTEQVQKATDWVNENRDQVHQFFQDSLNAAEAIAGAVFEIAKAATALFDDEKVANFARAFRDVLLPALTTVIISLGEITDAMAKFLDLPVVGEVAQFALSFGLLFKAFSTIGRLLGGFSDNLVKLLGRGKILGPVIRTIGAGLRFVAAILTGPWGLAIAAAVTAIIELDQKFHFLGPTVRFIGGLLKTVLGGAFDFLKSAIATFADVFLGAITSILGGVSSFASALSFLPGIGGAFKTAANAIDGIRDSIDGYRESLRGLDDDHKDTTKTIEALQNKALSLRNRLSTLKKGSDEYDKTASALRVTQRRLNATMEDASAKGRRGARGPRALGRSAESAAESVDKANAAIARGYNQLAKQLGSIKEITYRASGVTVRGARGELTADTGDILAGTTERRAMGGWIGRNWGPQGPDNRMIMVGDREAVVNESQQGPVEEGLALRSMLFGGPGSLDDLFRMFGGSFQRGGRVAATSLKGASASLLRYVESAMRYGLSVSSGFRRGSITSSGNLSHHATGHAVDLAGTAAEMMRFARHAVSTWGRRLEELFYTPLGYSIKNGRRVAPIAASDHYDHVHLADVDGGPSGGLAGLEQIARQRIRGPAGALRRLAQRAVDRVRNAANDRIGDAFSAVVPDVGGRPGAGRPANAAQIRRWIVAGLELAGQKATRSAIATLFGRIMQESGGDPKAINNWDSNAQRGDPSKGILQTIGATFRRYMVRGHGNIFNPVDNIAAAVRYMLATYGRLVGAGPGGYQTGGFVGRRTGRSYTPSLVFNTSFRGILDQIGRIQAGIQSLNTRAPGFMRDFERSISAITDEKGLLDQARDAIARVVNGMALRLRQASLIVTRSGTVIQRLSPQQQNILQISQLDRQRDDLERLRRVASQNLTDVERRLRDIQRGGVSERERKTYETLVAARRALITKITDLDVTIADAVQARFDAQNQILQDAIDKVNATAQRVLTRADLADRIATVFQSVSPALDPAAFALRGAAIQARGNALVEQRNRLGQFAGIASALGRQDLVAELVAQIEELNVSLLENAVVLRANTVAARQAQIDAIANRGSFRTGIATSLASLVQTIGQTTGTLDIDRVRGLTEAAGITLRNTGEGLRRQLAEAFGIDLRGLDPTALSDAIRNLDFDQIDAVLSPEQQQQFQGLITAIIDNAGAVAQNTQQLKELGGSIEQSFSSSAWQLFRHAIFTGSGGLLPQYQFRVPMMQTGGTILSGGLAYLHPGEIVPARVSRDLPRMGGDTNIVNVTSPTQVLDPSYLASVLSFRRSVEKAT